MKRRLFIGVALVALVAGVSLILGRSEHLTARPGDNLQALIDDADAGDTLELAPGQYEGPVTIGEGIRLLGSGAVITAGSDDSAALLVTGDGATLDGITLLGGETGLAVRGAERVLLRDVSVSGQPMHGIEVVDASARISRARVQVDGEYAQGIEVRNSDDHPDSVIEGSTVSGGQEGIVSHVSEVIVRGNVVRDATLRGITITEMSDGIVRDNDIVGVSGAGLYCGDMSRCEFTGNAVGSVASNGLGTSGAGWGLLVTYHSSASESGNELAGDAGPVNVMLSSRLIERSPLEPGRGAGAVPYAVGSLAAGLIVLFLLSWLGGPKVRPLVERYLRPGEAWVAAGAAVLFVSFLVQSFHMVEHFLQLFRVFVDGVPSRGGLVGPRVEAEWVHLIYNSLFLAGMGAVVMARAAGWGPKASTADSVLGAGVILQGYHLVEHVVKVVQHVTTGAKVNPGIAGEFTNLVLLHFGLNSAIYIALVFAGSAYIFRSLKLSHKTRSVPA